MSAVNLVLAFCALLICRKTHYDFCVVSRPICNTFVDLVVLRAFAVHSLCCQIDGDAFFLLVLRLFACVS